MTLPAHHAWTHRPKELGGTDPISTPYIRARIESQTVTAGDHSSSAFTAVPFHEDYNPSGIQVGGFSLDGAGGVVLPAPGFYLVTVTAVFADGDWTSNNFILYTYYLTGAQVLNDVLGSQILEAETLEHSMSHDGTGMTNTVDRRKPQMQSQSYFRAFKSFNAPIRIVPTYYSYTSGLDTGWDLFECVVQWVGPNGSLVVVPS